MDRYFILTGILAAALLSPANAEEIRQEMREVYSSYEGLQQYLAAPQKFEDQKNHSEIRSLLSSLTENFHKVDQVDSRFKAEPGFESNVKLVRELLDDSLKRFNEGNKSYSLRRLKALSGNCVTCHATHNVTLSFKGQEKVRSQLGNRERADFYLSSRQYTEAAKAFEEMLKSADQDFDKLNALRKWLLIQTRIKSDPKRSYATLASLTSHLKLTAYERETVHEWLSSLRRWSEQGEAPKTVPEVELLIRESISGDLLQPRIDEVSLLRATAVLHSLLPGLRGDDRGRSLYLLGASYHKLSPFFLDELPEIYLRLCIEESPGGKQAKAAFKLYEEIVVQGFTGSGRVKVPSDVQLKLIELYNKAHNIPDIGGRV